MAKLISVIMDVNLTDPDSWDSGGHMETSGYVVASEPLEGFSRVQTKQAFCKLCNEQLVVPPPYAASATLDGKTVPAGPVHIRPTGCPIDHAKFVYDESRIEWREPPPPPPDPMKDAIKTKLHALIDAEDFGARSLATLIKVARSAREMLLAEQPGSRWRPRSRIYGGGVYQSPMMGGMDPDGLDDDGGPAAQIPGDYIQGPGGMIGGPLAPSSFQETFGASVIREAIGALPQLLQKPEKTTDLVDALALAKANELHELADMLTAKIKARLGNMAPEPPKEEPTAGDGHPHLAPPGAPHYTLPGPGGG